MTTPDALPPLSDEQRERIRARLMAMVRERNKGMSDIERKIGPNVRRLMAYYASHDAIPPGGGMGDAIKSITTPGRMAELARNALVKVTEAIHSIRTAPDNPYGDDDETIAGVILAEIEKRQPRR